MNIQVFEHEILKVGNKGFTELHWKKLMRLNEQAKFQYMDIGYHYIRFKQYVGVLQVGGIQLEILPKVDNIVGKENENFWQNVLMEMLMICHKIPIIHLGEARLKFKNTSLLDIYIYYFLELLEKLIQEGIVKKYEYKEQNSTVLKGKLLLSKHIQKNKLNASQFYIRHQKYNTNHIFHQLIAQSLLCIQQQVVGKLINQKIEKLLSYFPLQKKLINPDFDKLVFTKNNKHYERVIQFCKLFLVNESPQLLTGKNFILSLLFDMNQLWEEYIYRQFKFLASEYDFIKVYSKKRVNFWGESSYVEPDIIVQLNEERIIVDTKWKVLTNLNPNHKDLQQMFVYNYLHNASRAILLYPKAYFETGKKDYFYQYDQRKGHVVNEANQCEIAFIDICQGEKKVMTQLKKLIINESF